VAKVDNFRLERLPARKGEELLDQPGTALGRSRHHIDTLERLRVLGHGALQKMRRTDNDSEEVIEVMRDSTCHLAERLKLLRLAQRFLGLTQLGSVEQSGDGASIFGWFMKDLQ
jgi:hypothetical protein